MWRQTSDFNLGERDFQQGNANIRIKNVSKCSYRPAMPSQLLNSIPPSAEFTPGSCLLFQSAAWPFPTRHDCQMCLSPPEKKRKNKDLLYINESGHKMILLMIMIHKQKCYSNGRRPNKYMFPTVLGPISGCGWGGEGGEGVRVGLWKLWEISLGRVLQ